MNGGTLHLTYRGIETEASIAVATGINIKFIQGLRYHYDSQSKKEDEEESDERTLWYVKKCGNAYYWQTMVDIKLEPSKLLLPVGYYLETLNKIAGRGLDLLYSKWEEDE